MLVGSNMSGTEKLPLLVIGKSAKPRAFKNKEVPLGYKSNRKAWMTGKVSYGFPGLLEDFQRICLKNGLGIGIGS